MENNCIFCEIVAGNSLTYTIWEDKDHVAFLSFKPNTDGVTVVIPKKHYPSYAFDLPDEVLQNLILAAKQVAKLLDEKFADVGRTALVFEGFGVDHVHAKLFPLHGTRMNEWKQISSNVDKFFDRYEGYISSHDYKRADDEYLLEMQKRIKTKMDKRF